VPEGTHGPVKRKPIGEVTFDDRWGETPSWVGNATDGTDQ